MGVAKVLLPIIIVKFLRIFFDLIVVDECHRGSAREESNWREILDYFESAIQIGMTATPKREIGADNIEYFGKPLYVYSLKQGIEDGFLAPFQVVRVYPEFPPTCYVYGQQSTGTVCSFRGLILRSL